MKMLIVLLLSLLLGAKVARADTTTSPASQPATQQAVTSETLQPDADGNWTLWLGMTLEEARKVAIASANNGVVKSTDTYKPTLINDDGSRQIYECVVWNGKDKATYTLTVEAGKVVRLRRPTDN